jgi:hypothetical protein
MTSDPTNDDPARGDRPSSGAATESRLPPESRGARSLTDRSKVEEASADEPSAEPERGPRIWPRVVGVLILLIGVGGAWIWQNPGFVQNSLGSLFPGSVGNDTDAAAIKTLEARVTRLENGPAPADQTAFAQRLDSLEKRLPPAGQSADSGGQPAVDLHPLLARLDVLEARVRSPQAAPPGQTSSIQSPASSATDGSDPRPLGARLDALEKRVAEHTVDPGKVAALASQVQELTARDPATDLRGKLDQIEHQVSGLAANGAKLAEGSVRAARLGRLEAAEFALNSGRPLGVIADAPPALARFATTAPPTQAALRLAFPAAANAALKVSTPDTEGKSFLDGILARLQDFRLITVREGDHVVIGNAASATLAHARLLLDAGDLAGAVREVSGLIGPPAEKMAPWLADATALLSAREALASLAESG